MLEPSVIRAAACAGKQHHDSKRQQRNYDGCERTFHVLRLIAGHFAAKIQIISELTKCDVLKSRQAGGGVSVNEMLSHGLHG